MSRRIWTGFAAALLCVVILVAGRYEKASASRAQVHGMGHVLALVGPHRATAETAYRLSITFDCLLYRAGPDPYALELCFDPNGRLVEAVDRRGDQNHPKFWTLRFDPGASTLHVAPARLVAAFVAAGAIPKGSTSLPLAQYDGGPRLVTPKHHRRG